MRCVWTKDCARPYRRYPANTCGAYNRLSTSSPRLVARLFQQIMSHAQPIFTLSCALWSASQFRRIEDSLQESKRVERLLVVRVSEIMKVFKPAYSVI